MKCVTFVPSPYANIAAGAMKARTRGVRVNYRELACADETLPRLPRKTLRSTQASRDTNGGTYYPVNLVERNGTRVLIHYVGYDSLFDEWREEKDLVNMPSPCLANDECYDLHQDLALKIKSSLTSKRKSNPVVRVDMQFDKQTFCQGLQCKGTETRTVKGNTYYKINTYKDLDELLGHNWHYRGINSAGDFCYVMLDTIEYHLYRRNPLIHYVPDENGRPIQVKTPQGHALVFTFVMGDGVASDFGKSGDIFT